MSVLNLSIDASQVPAQDQKQQRVRIAVQQGSTTKSQVVAVAGGKAAAKFDVDPKQTASIAVGPENASDADLFHLQTLTASVLPNQWGNQAVLTLPALAITPKWWGLWLAWCREFVINGRVVCADGSPVPGAEVHAYDVDFFWWWSSVVQVGPTAVTDAAGHFTIKFRWCCGWWPWWWWELRQWRLETLLVDRINPVLKLNPAIKFPVPDPVPSLDWAALNPQPLPPRAALASGLAVTRKIDPSVIPALRDRLLSVLPQVPELERLRLWPWYPWTPWFDCTPDIIFKVTQACGGPAKLIVNESIFQTRWDIPTSLNVTLVGNQDACCVPPPPPPPLGDCVVITGVCGDPGIPVTSIGRTGVTAGYADPGGRDRPFSELVTLSGQFGTASQADFYEVEYTPHGVNGWAPVPPPTMQDMTRGYFDATQAWPNQWFYVAFPVKTFGSLHVYESRQRYEVTNPPANWGQPMTGRTWFYNVNLLASLETAGNIPDGTYDFRIVGYKALPSGDPDPASRKVIDGCGNHQDNNLIVLAIDNRIVGPQVQGTVHVSTNEPDCGINAVRIGGAAVAPCGAHQLQPKTSLEIDFFCTDPDGHLDHFDLVVKYDLGSIKNLMNTVEVGSFTLSVLSGGPQGPDYSNAVAAPQSSPRPVWNGGTLRLHIDDASKVFPKTCCYLIELTVWKRNIVNCDGHLSYYNQMHDSFTVTV